MSEYDADFTSGVSNTPVKSGVEYSEIGFSSSSGRSPREKSTTDCQPMEWADPTICARIRQAIAADKSLSLHAQNVEISIAPRGVTLSGSVKSKEEREKIERSAAAVVKVGKIVSKLFVRPFQQLKQAKSSRRNEEPMTEQECDRIRRLWGIALRSEL